MAASDNQTPAMSFEPCACRRLAAAILLSAFQAIGDNDEESSEAESWLLYSPLAYHALSALSINQAGNELTEAINFVRQGQRVRLYQPGRREGVKLNGR